MELFADEPYAIQNGDTEIRFFDNFPKEQTLLPMRSDWEASIWAGACEN
jgi:hypothetical protein